MSFDRLGLEPEFLRAVADQGYTEPTPVQAESIPLVLAGRDLMAGAQTGTGKTAAFVLPMLQRLGRAQADPRAGRRPVRALVLAPTRELALQVEESVRVYGRHRAVRSTAIYGGVGFGPQVTTIRRGVDVVVATPGRLLDHLGQGTIELSRVEILVLDEADRMLDMGFIRDIRKVLDVLPSERQNLLFSATFSDEIRSLARGFLRDPATVQVTPRNSAAPLVTQVVHPVDRERKRELLSHLIRTGAIDQALVFTRTKHGANRLAQQLERDGIAAAAIHGNKSQSHRVRALADFKAGRAPILVATEIAARGLDIDGLPHVVNFELPMVPEDYVHRIGRTGRAGSPGHAVSLVCVDEHKLLGDIQRVLGRPIPREAVAGFEPDRSIRPEPIVRGGLGRERPAPRGDRRLGAHARPGVQARPGAQARPGVQARPGAQARPVAQTRPGVQARPGAQARPGVQARPVAQTRPGVQARPGAQARPGVQARPGTQARPGVQARPDGQPMPAAQPRPDMQSRSGAQPLPGAPIGHPASTLRNDSRPHSGRHKRRPDGGRPRPGTSLGAHPGGSRQTGTRPSGSQPAGSGTSGDRSSEGWPSGNRPVVLPGERLAHAERTRS